MLLWLIETEVFQMPQLHKHLNVGRNFMETFKIKSTSWVLFLFTILIVVIGGIILSTKFFPLRHNTGLAVPIVISLFVLAYFLTRLTSLAIIEITMTEEKLHLNWLKNYLFQSISEATIYWSDISEYKFQRDRNFDLLKFKLVDGTVFRLWHNNGLIKDDFYKLVPAFEKAVANYNESDKRQAGTIKRGKTIYETPLGLVLAVFTGLCLIAIPVLILILPTKSRINWAGLGAAYAGGLFFIGQVIHFRRKKASANKSIANSGAGG